MCFGACPAVSAEVSLDHLPARVVIEKGDEGFARLELRSGPRSYSLENTGKSPENTANREKNACVFDLMPDGVVVVSPDHPCQGRLTSR
jgi:hypothetical protein